MRRRDCRYREDFEGPIRQVRRQVSAVNAALRAVGRVSFATEDHRTKPTMLCPTCHLPSPHEHAGEGVDGITDR